MLSFPVMAFWSGHASQCLAVPHERLVAVLAHIDWFSAVAPAVFRVVQHRSSFLLCSAQLFEHVLLLVFEFLGVDLEELTQ